MGGESWSTLESPESFPGDVKKLMPIFLASLGRLRGDYGELPILPSIVVCAKQISATVDDDQCKLAEAKGAQK